MSEWDKFYRSNHGSLHDRGMADSYYGRSPRPHYWNNGNHHDEVIVTSEEEVNEYMQGYKDNTEQGNFKVW